ncbi:MAG TPA: glycosyltransferase [Terriglobales bacterium]
MSRRIVILTEIIAPYRIPVFNALADHDDIDLHVIFLAETDPTQRQWLVHKEDIRFSYEVLPSLRKRLRGQNFLLNWGVSDALKNAASDAILCGGYNYLASWASLRWAERNDIPFYLWVESTAKNFRSGDRWTESLKVRFMDRCTGFVVPGSAAARYIEGYGIPSHKIFTAPNAVDNDFFGQRSASVRQRVRFHRFDLGLPSRYFLCTGRLVKEKGIFDLLDAYGMLPTALKREVGLVYVGDGPARAELALKIKTEDLAASVVLAGFAQRDRLAQYYALADALVFPTHADAWGLVVNEAMACGLPVICSDAAGCAADLVAACGNGFIVPARGVAQLSAVMAELARANDLRLCMGRRSREHIRNFSPGLCAMGIANAILAAEVCAA